MIDIAAAVLPLDHAFGDTVGGAAPQPLCDFSVEPLSEQKTSIAQDKNTQTGQSDATNTASNANGIDPTFLEALPAHLRAQLLASQQAQSVPPPVFAPAPSTAEEIDPGFQHCHLLYLRKHKCLEIEL
ncbi:E3 ubiquitin protein ligase UPL1-like protein [Tanacetum coccineum]